MTSWKLLGDETRELTKHESVGVGVGPIESSPLIPREIKPTKPTVRIGRSSSRGGGDQASGSGIH